MSLRLPPGSFHASLGENGAGKSTLVKCMMGYHRPDRGHLSLDGVRRDIHNPRQALRLGIGMVYQHFTLVPNMTAAENIVLGANHIRARHRLGSGARAIEAFQRDMPFHVDLDARVCSLAAGEKQKLEILKQLYLGRRVLILDEPTRVLTPAEADQVLGMLRDMTSRHAQRRADHAQVPRGDAFARRSPYCAQAASAEAARSASSRRRNWLAMMFGGARVRRRRTGQTRPATFASRSRPDGAERQGRGRRARTCR